MRILFATDAVNNVSTQLNAPNYARLNELPGVSIDFYNHNYADYDVILFMGYDPKVSEARKVNPSARIGVIDIRPSILQGALGADFVIANGIEVQDVLSEYFENIFLYPICPELNVRPKEHTDHSPLIVGYHGNKVHLTAVMPYISAALDELAKQYPIELWAIYDLQGLGSLPFDICDSASVKVRFFQWAEDVYEKVLAQADVGIVPNTIPFHDSLLAKRQIAPLSSAFQPHETDILLRFKSTTNPGRIYIFSQLGIPVVAGFAPSAAQVIRHGSNSYLANSAGGWYQCLRSLLDSASLRNEMGHKLYEEYHANASPKVLNPKLVEFIRDLKPLTNIPTARLTSAEKRLKRVMS